MRTDISLRAGTARRWMLAAFTAGAALFMGVPTAGAEVRSGQAGDARDTTPDVNGLYRHADIEQVRVTYDTAGALEFVVRLFEPVPEVAEGNITTALGSWSSGFCSLSPQGVMLTFAPQRQDPVGTGLITVMGLEGSISTTRRFSADTREVIIEASHPALTNRPLNCVDETNYGYSYDSFWCSSVTFNCYDTRRATIDSVPAFEFGTPPPPPPPPPVRKAQCEDEIDNDDDGRMDLDDEGCAYPEDPSERLGRLPSLTKSDATRYARTALRRRFGASYTNGYVLDRRGRERKPRVSCKRLSRIRMSCRTNWNIGDLSYRGHVRIWHSKDGEDLWWNYSMRIVRTNHYCQAVKKRNCRRTIIVR